MAAACLLLRAFVAVLLVSRTMVLEYELREVAKSWALVLAERDQREQSGGKGKGGADKDAKRQNVAKRVRAQEAAIVHERRERGARSLRRH